MSNFANDDSSASVVDESNQWVSSARLVSRDKLPKLLEQHRPYLKSIAEREVPQYLMARFDSSDVVQETLLKAFRQFDQFVGSTDVEFTGWVREILLNQIVDAKRHHGRQKRDLHRDQAMPTVMECHKSMTASELAIQNEQHERVAKALEQLPDEYRMVLKLRQELDLEFSEIGERMQRSADAARMLWGRAVLLLSKLMKRDE